jgi:hypothetical protein
MIYARGFESSVTIGLAILFSVFFTSGLHAQDAPVELGGSYVWEDQKGLKLPLGWSVSVAGPLSDHFAIVGEFAASYDLERVPNIPGFVHANERYIITNHSFTVGPRVIVKMSTRTSAFAQVLVGRLRMAGDPWEPFGWTDWLFVAQPGVGISLKVSGRLATRVTFDVPIVREDEFIAYSVPLGYFHMTRLGVGLAWPMR